MTPACPTAQSSWSHRQYRVISTLMVEAQVVLEPGGSTSPGQVTKEGVRKKAMLELTPGSRQRKNPKVREAVAYLGIPTGSAEGQLCWGERCVGEVRLRPRISRFQAKQGLKYHS